MVIEISKLFDVEPQWVVALKFLGHITKMAAVPIYEPRHEKTGFLPMPQLYS